MKNQPDMNVRNGFIQAPKAIKMPVMQEFVTVTTPYNTINWRFISIGVNVSTPASSGSVNNYVASCPSPTPPSVCIWNGRICKYRADYYPKLQVNQLISHSH